MSDMKLTTCWMNNPKISFRLRCILINLYFHKLVLVEIIKLISIFHLVSCHWSFKEKGCPIINCILLFVNWKINIGNTSQFFPFYSNRIKSTENKNKNGHALLHCIIVNANRKIITTRLGPTLWLYLLYYSAILQDINQAAKQWFRNFHLKNRECRQNIFDLKLYRLASERQQQKEHNLILNSLQYTSMSRYYVWE